MTSMYALGWTQHSKGSQNIRCMAMLQLILGNIGVRGGGMNALARSLQHSGADRPRAACRTSLPGYLTLPTEQRASTSPRTCRRAASGLCGLGQMSYWQNYRKFLGQLPEVDVGRRCNA